MHDINVTPFIDVMLVLLIIFMVAAPLATVESRSICRRPRRTAAAPVQAGFLTIKADLVSPSVTIRLRANSLAAALDAATGSNKDERIFLRADRAVPYGDVMQVMNVLRAANYLKVALVGLETRDAK